MSRIEELNAEIAELERDLSNYEQLMEQNYDKWFDRAMNVKLRISQLEDELYWISENAMEFWQ